MTQIDEQWLEIPKVQKQKKAIVAISNTGKYRRADGTIGILSLRRPVRYEGKREEAYRLIAKHFLITVIRPDQTLVDHITHHPSDYNVNNVLNLRWCTRKENSGFEEARENNGMRGRTADKSPSWRGTNVGPQGAYIRAKKLYKACKITEEEFQPYRDALAEYMRFRRSNKATSSAHE